jgi:hypothetical protein
VADHPGHDDAVAAFGDCPTCALADMDRGLGAVNDVLAGAGLTVELDTTPLIPPPGPDARRLARQLHVVYEAMLDARWHTLADLAEVSGAPEASVSARIRDLRAIGYTVDRQRVPGGNGLHRYRLHAT